MKAPNLKAQIRPSNQKPSSAVAKHLVPPRTDADVAQPLPGALVGKVWMWRLILCYTMLYYAILCYTMLYTVYYAIIFYYYEYDYDYGYDYDDDYYY